MKKLKLVLVVAVTLLFLGMGSANAQEQPTKTVLINTTEFPFGIGGPYNANMVIVDAVGNVNTIPLQKGKDAIEKNAPTIHKEIEKWKQEGYKITHFSTSGDGTFRYTTIILEK
ncbi:MAG TPA: hypothetical protein PLP27_01925 [Crocinitomicaceae bacterium]|nr:hypothetical protein [Crocinitomicaceae bacterium]